MYFTVFKDDDEECWKRRFRGKNRKNFFLLGGGGADPLQKTWWGGERTPFRNRARGTGPSLAFHITGDEGYVNGVQPPPPLSEIPGSAPAYSH